MKNKWILISFIAMVVGLGACAKDRTADDYKSEHDAENRAKIAASVGVFRGNLVSSADGAFIAPIQYTLLDPTTCTESTSSSTSPTAAGTETSICGTVEILQQGQPLILSFAHAAVDPNRLEFKAVVAVDGRGTAELRGVISGDILTGSIQVTGYQAQSGNFRLTRNGAASDGSSLRGRVPDVIDQAIFQTFVGTPTFNDGGPNWPVKMFISKEQTIQEQDFLEDFMPVRYVDVLLRLRPNVEAGMHHMMWDRRTRKLTGQTVQWRLDCIEVVALTGNGWNCSLVNVGVGVGPVFSGVFLPAHTGGAAQ